jgi:hypothetical protein
MGIVYSELKSRIESKNCCIEDAYFEVADAYQKGVIDCNEYIELYDMLKKSSSVA